MENIIEENIVQENIVEEKKSTYTPAVKKAIYKWRETHSEKFREYANKWAIDNYYKNAEKYKEYARVKYREKQLEEGSIIRPRGRPKKVKKQCDCTCGWFSEFPESHIEHSKWSGCEYISSKYDLSYDSDGELHGTLKTNQEEIKIV